MPNTVDDDADLHELSGSMALPLTGRADGETHSARRRVVDPDDLAAQVAPGEHRVEEFEVPVDRMRRQCCLDDRSDQAVPAAGAAGGGTRSRVLGGRANAHGLGSVRMISVYRCTQTSVTRRRPGSSSRNPCDGRHDRREVAARPRGGCGEYTRPCDTHAEFEPARCADACGQEEPDTPGAPRHHEILVGERSFGSISLREVARGAGIVPTAFYRHFASMEDLGVTVVEDSMRVLRRALREGRRDLAARQAMPTAKNSLDILLRHVRENESQFRFLIREQHGGIAEIRRAIDTELRLFSKELTIDLARIPDLAPPWQPEDLEIAAELIVTIMLTAVADLLDGEYRGRGAEKEIVERTERQLVMVFLGMGQWRPSE